jgi:hypothetical protein
MAKETMTCQETKDARLERKEPNSEDMEPETENHGKINAWIADMMDVRKERTACQEATETNPDKAEHNPEMMQSVAEDYGRGHSEIFGTNEKVAQGPASSCRAKWRAKGTDPKGL